MCGVHTRTALERVNQPRATKPVKPNGRSRTDVRQLVAHFHIKYTSSLSSVSAQSLTKSLQSGHKSFTTWKSVREVHNLFTPFQPYIFSSVSHTHFSLLTINSPVEFDHSPPQLGIRSYRFNSLSSHKFASRRAFVNFFIRGDGECVRSTRLGREGGEPNCIHSLLSFHTAAAAAHTEIPMLRPLFTNVALALVCIRNFVHRFNQLTATSATLATSATFAVFN